MHLEFRCPPVNGICVTIFGPPPVVEWKLLAFLAGSCPLLSVDSLPHRSSDLREYDVRDCNNLERPSTSSVSAMTEAFVLSHEIASSLKLWDLAGQQSQAVEDGASSLLCSFDCPHYRYTIVLTFAAHQHQNFRSNTFLC